MNWRTRVLAGGTALTAALGVAAVVLPPGRIPGDTALTAAGLVTIALLAVAGTGRDRAVRGWRLLSLALLFPALRTLIEAVVHLHGSAALVLHWGPTIPGYVIAVAAALAFLDPARLRAAGARVGVELALFTTASLLVVQLLVLGPDGRWTDLSAGHRWVVGLTLGSTAAGMAAALIVVGMIEAGRQRVALGLLAGSVLMTAGRALGLSASLSGGLSAPALGRLLLVTGMVALVLAAAVDRSRGTQPGERSGTRGRSAAVGHLLPHAAMVTAVLLAAAIRVAGHRSSGVTFVGICACVGLAGVHRWLSLRDERRMAARLTRSEGWFRSLVRAGGDAVLVLDDDVRVTWASPSLERVLGPASSADLVGRSLLEAVHPDDVDTITAALPGRGTGTAAPDDVRMPVLRLRDDDGIWRFLEAGVCDLRTNSDVAGVVLQCRDMTERHAREEALRSIAYTDPMTGLPNAAGWVKALDRAVAEATAAAASSAADPTQDGANGIGSAVLLVELDGLVEAREQAGREIVTAVVAEVGRRLRATVRGDDVDARLGGGAFAVLAAGTPAESDRLAARCLSVVEQPIVTPSGLLDLSASIGIAPVEAGLPSEELRARAELAARAARASGPGGCARYSPRLGDAALRRERLSADLEGATARGELSIALQPAVALADQRIRGFEALARWRHPELGEVPPTEFVPIAERAGLIGGLQRWVLAEATAAAAALPQGEQPLYVSVNLAAGYLTGGTVVADVEAALRASGVSPQSLVLEITETAACSDVESVALDVQTLRLMGVHVALDDFGRGESTLGSLTRVSLDVLKLDPSLTTRIDRDRKALALCESIVGVAHALGLAVIAEGVETPAQLGSLCGIGCDYVQGFLLARPMGAAELAELIREGAGQLWPGLVGSR